MPTYEYECNACGHEFEKFQNMTDKTMRKCPECGKKKLQRLIGAGAGIIFKGSGFYETDYKRKESKTGSDNSSSKDKDSSSNNSDSSAKSSDKGEKSSSSDNSSSKSSQKSKGEK